MFDCEKVMDFAEKLRQAQNELLELDATCKIGDPHFVNKFLSGLGSRFDIFLTTFNQTHSLIPLAALDDQVEMKAVTFDKTVMAADKEEKRMTTVEDQSSKMVAFVSNLARSTDNKVTVTVPYCTHCKKNYHTVNARWDLHPELRCAADKKRKNGKRHSQKPKQSKPTKEDDEPAFEEPSVHFMATTLPASSIKPRQAKSLWILDTGCSQHIMSRQADFINLQPYSGGLILGIGNTQLTPKGQGTLKVACKVRGRQVIMLLSNALWCPDVGVSLISVSQLLRKDVAQILCSGKVFIATQRGGLFFLDIWTQSAIPGHTLASYGVVGPTLQVWHERLAHLGGENLKLSCNMSTGIGSATSAICLCKPCVMGRMKEVPHTSSSKGGTYPMEFVHTDVAGRFPVPGFDGPRYWVTFPDDYT